MGCERLFLLTQLLLLILRCNNGMTHESRSSSSFFTRYKRAVEGDCFQSLVVKGNGGTITSPNFPNNYPSSADCRWLLTTEQPNATILLKIDSLNIEPDTDCKLDYLQVYLGSTSLAPSLGPFCGSLSNRLLKTNSSKLLLVFHSDPLYEDKGFSLDYFTQTTADCQNLLTEESGSLRSPGFPGNYPDGTDCWTLIRVSEGKRVLLFFDSLDIEYGDNCTFDYVRVLDGEARNSSILGQLCRRSDVSSFESSSNSLLVHFHSDSSVNKKGFRARYSSVDKRSSPVGDCQWETAESNGTIASPNHPSNYHSFSNCSLWILAPQGTKIAISFDALQLEMDPECLYDFLQIEEPGPTPSSDPKVLGRFCGNEGETKNLTSSQNEVHVRFQTDDFVEFSGFKLRYWFLNNNTVQKEKIIHDEGTSKLSFSVVPQNATLDVGASHMLHCSTQHPSAKIRWLKGDTFLAGGSPLPGLRVLANNTLWIHSMDHPLSGIYSCVAVSPDAETITAKAYVLIKNTVHDDLTCGIVFRKTPKDSSFAEGEFAHLECLVAGAQVQMSWEKDGHPLQAQKHITILKNGYIFMDRVRMQDSGVYTCVARDMAAGCEKKASALLQVAQRIKIEEICGRPKIGKPSPEIPQMDHGKIIGGHNAKKGAYPWQVMLWEPNLKSFCGATILNERWIATAAHCFINYKNLRWDRVVIKFGKFDREREEEQEFRTGVADSSSIVVHPAYNRYTFDNDLALVRLREHIQFTDYILPVCLGDRNLTQSLINGQSNSKDRVRLGTVIGWGKLKDNGPSPRYLQEIMLPVVDQDICMHSTNYTVTRNMFCAGYSQEILGDACHGDSGGPFLMTHDNKWYLVGIVSWGEGCGSQNKYGFYTRISNYISWIQGIIKS